MMMYPLGRFGCMLACEENFEIVMPENALECISARQLCLL